MTFLETLQSHKGGLIRLKTEIYRHDGRGYDGSPGRVCLILDAASKPPNPSSTNTTITTTHATIVVLAVTAAAAAHLLIDGTPQWVWVAEADVEVLQ